MQFKKEQFCSVLLENVGFCAVMQYVSLEDMKNLAVALGQPRAFFNKTKQIKSTEFIKHLRKTNSFEINDTLCKQLHDYYSKQITLDGAKLFSLALRLRVNLVKPGTKTEIKKLMITNNWRGFALTVKSAGNDFIDCHIDIPKSNRKQARANAKKLLDLKDTLIKINIIEIVDANLIENSSNANGYNSFGIICDKSASDSHSSSSVKGAVHITDCFKLEDINIRTAKSVPSQSSNSSSASSPNSRNSNADANRMSIIIALAVSSNQMAAELKHTKQKLQDLKEEMQQRLQQQEAQIKSMVMAILNDHKKPENKEKPDKDPE